MKYMNMTLLAMIQKRLRLGKRRRSKHRFLGGGPNPLNLHSVLPSSFLSTITRLLFSSSSVF